MCAFGCSSVALGGAGGGGGKVKLSMILNMLRLSGVFWNLFYLVIEFGCDSMRGGSVKVDVVLCQVRGARFVKARGRAKGVDLHGTKPG